jgi:hypothetical protein
VRLSHTNVTLRSNSDGKDYDVAIDNVFAAGYDRQVQDVPVPLNCNELEVCGAPFSGGIHWVHDNCGDRPGPQDPDGWVKKAMPDGTVGPNLEDSRSYCNLWQRHAVKRRRSARQ